MFLLPDAVKSAVSLLNGAGHDCYPVGGCVRDLLRGKEPDDWDLCTSALPETMLEVFAAYPTFAVGAAHGTIGVILDGTKLEITTFRADGDYLDARHPSAVKLGVSLREDLARRDFTVNAMALDAENGIIDPFFGQTDLVNGILRAVGDPALRFEEDALRILRGLRFSAVLGFKLEENTEKAMKTAAPNLSRIARERVLGECFKLISGFDAPRVLFSYPDIIGSAFPALKSALLCRETLEKGVKALQTARSTESRLARFLAAMGQDGAVLQTEPLAKAQKETIFALISLENSDFSPETVYSLAVRIGKDAPRLLAHLFEGRNRETDLICALERIQTAHLPLLPADLALNGAQIAALTGAKGAQIGLLLRALLDEVARGGCENTPESLEKALFRLLETKKSQATQ